MSTQTDTSPSSSPPAAAAGPRPGPLAGLARTRVAGAVVGALMLATCAAASATGGGAVARLGSQNAAATPADASTGLAPAPGAVSASTASTTSSSSSSPAATASRAPRVRPGRLLALTPPMGWNGYNHFRTRVTAAIVEAEARALVSSGMAAAGYTYVNLDGGWDLLQRDAEGNLQPDPAKFPNGIKLLAGYVHHLGLKFGIYASAGTENCAATSAGSYGHYRQDAALFASWGVDYVKLDWCHIPYRDFPGMSRADVSQALADQMAAALAATGRPMVYDVNDTTQDRPWGSGGQPLANLWRTASDIQDSYSTMVRNFIRDVTHYSQARPGQWNDPDMLEVGNGGMTVTEYQSHFSLWAELAAPLIAGNDLTTMPAAIRDILTNRAVIAVDQDPSGRQGFAVSSTGGLWVLTRPLADGSRAVVLFNQTGVAARIATTTVQVGAGAARSATLRNIWTGAVTTTAGAISALVPPHGCVMYRVTAGGALPFSATSTGTSLKI